MRLDAAIEATHIGHTIVQIAFVMVVKRTLLGIINSRYYPAPPVLCFQIVGHIMSTKTLIFRGEPAKKCNIRVLMTIMEIKQIILQFHETLSGVVAGQAKMQFDIVRGINVTWRKHPFVHIVAH